jgi:glutaredoxin
VSLRSCAVLLAAVSSLAAADTLYRWTDKDGGIHYTDLPPQFEVKRLEIREMGSGNYVETSIPSYALGKALKDFPVTLYAAPDCSDECKTAREFLAKRGIAFSEVSVNSEAAVARYKGVFAGSTDIFLPALTVGSQKMKGFEQAAWTRMLDEAGYPKASTAGRPANDANPSAQKTP